MKGFLLVLGNLIAAALADIKDHAVRIGKGIDIVIISATVITR